MFEVHQDNPERVAFSKHYAHFSDTVSNIDKGVPLIVSYSVESETILKTVL